jgi:hypothetical protein
MARVARAARRSTTASPGAHRDETIVAALRAACSSITEPENAPPGDRRVALVRDPFGTLVDTHDGALAAATQHIEIGAAGGFTRASLIG